MTTKVWAEGDRVVNHSAPPLEPGGAGTVEWVAASGPHPVRVQWDVPQRSLVPGDLDIPRTSTLHWHGELAAARWVVEIEHGGRWQQVHADDRPHDYATQDEAWGLARYLYPDTEHLGAMCRVVERGAVSRG